MYSVHDVFRGLGLSNPLLPDRPRDQKLEPGGPLTWSIRRLRDRWAAQAPVGWAVTPSLIRHEMPVVSVVPGIEASPARRRPRQRLGDVG
jgi:hypothetical protein